MIAIGPGAKRKSESVRLSRYACYLIVQNADPDKEVVSRMYPGIFPFRERYYSSKRSD